MSETRIRYESSYHIASVAEILNPFDVGLYFTLKRLDSALVLDSEFFHLLIENLILLFLLLRKLFILVEELDLSSEYPFIISCGSVKQSVLFSILLNYLLIHFVEVVLGLLNKAVNLTLEVASAAVAFQLSDLLFEFGVLQSELFQSAKTHLNYIKSRVEYGLV